MKELPLTQAELDEIVAEAKVRLRAAREDTPRRIARDVKRIWNLQGRVQNQANVEVIRETKENVIRRLGRLLFLSHALTAVQKLQQLTQELQRPYRTVLQKRFAKAHDALCRENHGKLPSYGAVARRLETEGLNKSSGKKSRKKKRCEEDYFNDFVRNLKRVNKVMRLPMPRRGRPKNVTKKRPQ